MKCCVLIDISRTWLKFISHSLFFKGTKIFLLFFLILRTENQVIFVVLSMKLGLCLKVTSDVSSLFNSNNWALLYYASPVPLLWDFCHVRSCWQLTNCCVKGDAYSHKIPQAAKERKGLCIKQGEYICLDSLLLSCIRNLFQGKVALSIPKQSITWYSPQTPPDLLICSRICASNH